LRDEGVEELCNYFHSEAQLQMKALCELIIRARKQCDYRIGCISYGEKNAIHAIHRINKFFYFQIYLTTI